MKVFESNRGKVEKIRDGHFKVIMFTELGPLSFEKRHTTLDEVIYNNDLHYGTVAKRIR